MTARSEPPFTRARKVWETEWECLRCHCTFVLWTRARIEQCHNGCQGLSFQRLRHNQPWFPPSMYTGRIGSKRSCKTVWGASPRVSSEVSGEGDP